MVPLPDGDRRMGHPKHDVFSAKRDPARKDRYGVPRRVRTARGGGAAASPFYYADAHRGDTRGHRRRRSEQGPLDLGLVDPDFPQSPEVVFTMTAMTVAMFAS